MGIIVDSVSEVRNIKLGEIEDTPDLREDGYRLYPGDGEDGRRREDSARYRSCP